MASDCGIFFNGPIISLGFCSHAHDLVPDDLHNPKFWAKWFREFLCALRPSRAESKLAVPQPQWLTVVARCRSAPLQVREWKMKLWKQRLVVDSAA